MVMSTVWPERPTPIKTYFAWEELQQKRTALGVTDEEWDRILADSQKVGTHPITFIQQRLIELKAPSQPIEWHTLPDPEENEATLINEGWRLAYPWL